MGGSRLQRIQVRLSVQQHSVGGWVLSPKPLHLHRHAKAPGSSVRHCPITENALACRKLHEFQLTPNRGLPGVTGDESTRLAPCWCFRRESIVFSLQLTSKVYCCCFPTASLFSFLKACDRGCRGVERESLALLVLIPAIIYS